MKAHHMLSRTSVTDPRQLVLLGLRIRIHFMRINISFCADPHSFYADSHQSWKKPVFFIKPSPVGFLVFLGFFGFRGF
jgi:hypothetical protein